MKFILDRKEALSAMSRIASIVEGKSTVQILGNVLIESKQGVVCLRSSNLDMEAIESVSCDMLNEVGATTVPAKTLLDIIKNAPDGAQLKFELGERLVVKFGRSRFQLAVLAADMFPALMVGDIPGQFSISANILRDMMSRTRFSIETDIARTFIGGVRLEQREDRLYACATNGKTMAIVSTPAPEGSAGIALTIPPKMVDEMIKLLGSSEGDVQVNFSDRKISIGSGATVITSKIIDEKYPPFPLSEGQDVVMRTDRDGLIQMIRRVMVTADKDKGVRLTITDGGIAMTTRNVTDESEDELAADYEGAEYVVGFGANFLLGALENLRGDVVEFQFPSSKKGAVVVKAPVDPDTLMNLGTMRV